MKLLRKKSATSQILEIFIQDTRLGDGGGLTGLLFNTASLTCYYHRNTDVSAVAVTLVTMTVGTFTSSGFKEIDAVNMPGWYQLSIPNAALASGADSVTIHLKGAANMGHVPLEVQLTTFDVDTTLTDASITTAVWAAGVRTLTSFGTLAADVWASATRLLTAGTNIVLAKGTGVTGFNDLSAAAVNAEVDSALADAQLDEFVDMIELDGGLYRFTVAALANAPSGGGSLTAADVWAYVTRTLTAGTNIVLAKGTGVTGFNDLSAAQVNAEADTALVDYDAPTHTELIAEIDAVQADVATRASQTSLNTLDDFVDTEVAAIKAVTDAITATGTGLTAIPWNAAWDAEVQSEATDALNAYDPPTNAELVTEINSVQTDVAAVPAAVWASGTRTLTSFGTLVADTATAVWSAVTRVLTAGTNIVLAKGVGVTGFNDITTAQVNTEVDTALADYDAPTYAELVAEINAVQADIDGVPTAAENTTAVWAAATRELTSGSNIVLAKGVGVTGFNDLSAAQVNTEVDTALTDVALDQFQDMIELDGLLYRFTVEALAQAPTGGGGGGATAADVWAYASRTLTAGIVPAISQVNPSTLEVTVYRGDDYVVNPLSFTGMPNLTGATIVFRIGDIDDTAFATEVTCTYAAGTVNVYLSRDVTAALVRSTYHYTLESTLATYKRTLAQGKINVKGKVL